MTMPNGRVKNIVEYLNIGIKYDSTKETLWKNDYLLSV